jgi:hypothetical protein
MAAIPQIDIVLGQFEDMSPAIEIVAKTSASLSEVPEPCDTGVDVDDTGICE